MAINKQIRRNWARLLALFLWWAGCFGYFVLYKKQPIDTHILVVNVLIAIVLLLLAIVLAYKSHLEKKRSKQGASDQD